VPKRVIFFGIGIMVMIAFIGGVAIWASVGDGAGTQRGLVLRNVTASIVDVTLADGQTARIDPDDESIFVVRREDFPSSIRVVTVGGETLLDEEIEYAFLTDAEFRISFDENGFFPTTIVRSTPVRTTTPSQTPSR
jgi:hypothetical protein